MSNSSARRPSPGSSGVQDFQRQFGFLAGGDDADVEAGLPLHPGQELAAVGGAAAGLGGDGAQPAHRAAGQARGAGVQRGQGALHRGFAERAGVVQALAQPDDAGEAVEHAKAVAGRARPPACGSCWCQGRARRKPARKTGAPMLTGRRRGPPKGPPAASYLYCRTSPRHAASGQCKSRADLDANSPS